jgi:GLPGLI family protein
MKGFILTLLLAGTSILVYGQFEGRVSYKIAYQSDDPSMQSMMGMLPKESTMLVKGNRLRLNQSISGGGRQVFMSDASSGTSTLLMNLMGQEFKVNMKEEDFKSLKLTQKLEITETSGVKEIAGFRCKKAYALSDGDTLTVYYAPELQTNAILPQFSEIKGLPLMYEVARNNIKMIYTCTEVNVSAVEDAEFEIASSVKEIPFSDFARSFAVSK